MPIYNTGVLSQKYVHTYITYRFCSLFSKMQSYAVQVKQIRTHNTVGIWGGGAAVAGAAVPSSPVPLEVLETLGAGEGVPPGAGGGGIPALAPALLLSRQAGPGRAVPEQHGF